MNENSRCVCGANLDSKTRNQSPCEHCEIDLIYNLQSYPITVEGKKILIRLTNFEKESN